MTSCSCLYCPESFNSPPARAKHVAAVHPERKNAVPWLNRGRVVQRPVRPSLKRPSDCWPGRA